MNYSDFNPNNPGGADTNIFGLPYSVKDADMILIPVPWEATVSYGAGTKKGPAAILEASKQIDLFHPLLKEVWRKKMVMEDEDKTISKLSDSTRKKAEKIIARISAGKKPDKKLLK